MPFAKPFCRGLSDKEALIVGPAAPPTSVLHQDSWRERVACNRVQQNAHDLPVDDDERVATERFAKLPRPVTTQTAASGSGSPSPGVRSP